MSLVRRRELDFRIKRIEQSRCRERFQRGKIGNLKFDRVGKDEGHDLARHHHLGKALGQGRHCTSQLPIGQGDTEMAQRHPLGRVANRLIEHSTKRRHWRIWLTGTAQIKIRPHLLALPLFFIDRYRYLGSLLWQTVCHDGRESYSGPGAVWATAAIRLSTKS